MATAEEILPITRLRDGLGMVGDEADSDLTALREAAIGQVSQIVGRNILTRSGLRSSDLEFRYRYLGGSVDALTWLIPDVTGLSPAEVRYRPLGADPGASAPSSEAISFSDPRVSATPDEIFIYSRPGRPWREILEFDHPTPQITVSVGMQTADIPSQWVEAMILIVRSIFDGSSFDDVGTNSPVTHLLAPYRRWAGDR